MNKELIKWLDICISKIIIRVVQNINLVEYLYYLNPEKKKSLRRAKSKPKI